MTDDPDRSGATMAGIILAGFVLCVIVGLGIYNNAHPWCSHWNETTYVKETYRCQR